MKCDACGKDVMVIYKLYGHEYCQECASLNYEPELVVEGADC